jgi:hypothetical protein
MIEVFSFIASLIIQAINKKYGNGTQREGVK